MGIESRFTISLRAKLILMNALVVGLMGGALVYQQISLMRERTAIEDLGAALDRQKTLTQATILFDDFRYWSMDMLVTQLDGSARSASEARKTLNSALEGIEEAAWKGELARHLDAITEHVLNVFDATGEKNQAKGNEEVARCRARMSQGAILLQQALAGQETRAAAASMPAWPAPTTTTSVMTREVYPADRDAPTEF